QAVVDNAQDEDTSKDTGYTADTAGMGGAAYGCRRDGVQLVVQAGIGRVSRACAACQQHAGDGCTYRAPAIDQDQVLLYVDTSDTCRLVVAADGVNVFAEAGLREQKGRDGEHNEEHDDDDREIADLSRAEETEVFRQVGDRTVGVHFCACAADELC